jgi:pimeloyl-ACP methyl ester carboxylesterase
MQTAFIHYQSSQVHYSYCGNGETALVCLHGYGESSDSFHFLEQYLPAHYRLIAIDLPFHGQTQWKEGLNCTPQDLQAIIQSICTALHLSQAKIAFAGFSMGGRVALSLLQTMPAQTDRLLLLAPDGLVVNFWYRLAAQTSIGNRLFRFTMRHPTWFFWLLKTGKRLGLINPSIYKFTSYYIHDPVVREQLYQRWTCMRHFKPHLPAIKQLVRQQRIAVALLYGKYDRIILAKRGENFRRGIESFCTLQVISTGHQVLQEKNAAMIIQLLQTQTH